jgi:hypothetical protein
MATVFSAKENPPSPKAEVLWSGFRSQSTSSLYNVLGVIKGKCGNSWHAFSQLIANTSIIFSGSFLRSCLNYFIILIISV